MKNNIHVGSKVRLTPQRFSDFGGGQGVTDPHTVYTVEKIKGTDTVWLKEIVSQANDYYDVVPVKPTICILRKR